MKTRVLPAVVWRVSVLRPCRWLVPAVLPALLWGAGLCAQGARTRAGGDIRYTCVVLEDGESKGTAGWDLWRADPPGELANVLDPDDRRNRAIYLLSGADTVYRFTFAEPKDGMPVIQWRMRMEEARFYHYVECDTSMGRIHLRYTSGEHRDGQMVGQDPVIGLGPVAAQKWVTVRRNVLADLRLLYPDIGVLRILNMKFRGPCFIDDIRLYNYPDADRDLLPDEFERRRRGLDPANPNDATPELVAEVIRLTDSVAGRAEVPAEAAEPAPPRGENPSRAQRQVSLDDEEKAQMRALLQERIAHHLPNMPPPQAGKTYRVRLRDGALLTGELVRMTETQVVLRLPQGSLALALDRVNMAETADLFPQEAARQLARRDVQQRVDELLAAKRAALDSQEETAAGGQEEEAGQQEDAPAVVPGEQAGELAYDPMPAPTPERLKPTLQAFADWMALQQRRAGGRIVDRLYAKECEGCAVLYLVMDANFLAQDRDVRERTAVGIQQFWAFRCQGAGVVNLPRAHVVLLDGNGRIVGGSRPEAADKIWVAER